MAMEENMRKVLHRLVKAALTELDGINFDGGIHTTVYAMNATIAQLIIPHNYLFFPAAMRAN